MSSGVTWVALIVLGAWTVPQRSVVTAAAAVRSYVVLRAAVPRGSLAGKGSLP